MAASVIEVGHDRHDAGRYQNVLRHDRYTPARAGRRTKAEEDDDREFERFTQSLIDDLRSRGRAGRGRETPAQNSVSKLGILSDSGSNAGSERTDPATSTQALTATVAATAATAAPTATDTSRPLARPKESIEPVQQTELRSNEIDARDEEPLSVLELSQMSSEEVVRRPPPLLQRETLGSAGAGPPWPVAVALMFLFLATVLGMSCALCGFGDEKTQLVQTLRDSCDRKKEDYDASALPSTGYCSPD